MAKKRTKVVLGIAASGLLLTGAYTREHFFRINLDTFETSGYWQTKILGVPVFRRADHLPVKPGCSGEYAAIFGHPAEVSRTGDRGPDVVLNGWGGGSWRCGSYGMAYAERKALVEGLCQAHREGRVDATAARAFFARIDGVIPLRDRWVEFANDDYDRNLALTEGMRRELGMPLRYPSQPE